MPSGVECRRSTFSARGELQVHNATHATWRSRHAVDRATLDKFTVAHHDHGASAAAHWPARAAASGAASRAHARPPRLQSPSLYRHGHDPCGETLVGLDMLM